MDVDLINTIIKMFFINIFTFFTAFKAIGYKHTSYINKLVIVFTSIILTALYIILKKYINIIFIIVISTIIQIVILSYIINKHKNLLTIQVLMSNAIVYAIFAIATIIETIPKEIFKIENSTINFIIIVIIELFILVWLFRIKRIKDGFSFLKKNSNDYLDLIIINICAMIILAYCLFRKYHGDELIKHEFITLIVLILFMILIIQKTLNLYYKQNLLNKTIEEYKKEIKEKDQKIKELSNEKFNISKLNHEFYNRQMALELKVKELVSEAGEEIGILDRINNLTKEYSDNLQNLRSMPKLQLTDITEIDDMFKYMQEECYKSNIDFKLQIEGNIYYLINNIISKNKLETLIGDHIKDAIIAINSSNNKYKSIFVILGIKNNHYELCVYDTGKEFDIEVLLKLGLEPITSHRETGGSGIGFITTFETLKECKASLIIEEYNLDTTDYTKSVIIRFDNRNEYKIRTYRAEEIRKRSKDNRIIIENI